MSHTNRHGPPYYTPASADSQGYQPQQPPRPPPFAHHHSSPVQLARQQYPQPNLYYPTGPQTPGPAIQVDPAVGSVHYYPPSSISSEQHHVRNRPPLSVSLPGVPTVFSDPNTTPLPYGYIQHQELAVSPLQTPSGLQMLASGPPSSGSITGAMSDYFPPFASAPVPTPPIHPSLPSLLHNQVPGASWQSTVPSAPGPSRPALTSRMSQSSAAASGSGSGAKTSRQQFTACGACRHRRVKCDLKDRQESAERTMIDDEGGIGPHRISAAARLKKVICTNCQDRGTNCVDEYAPQKAAKQLRRGKRISEIELLYGKSAGVNLASSRGSDEGSELSQSPVKGKEREVLIPDLTREFFASPFFSRFQIQRPLLDPSDFLGRYFSSPDPCAAAMGPEGAVLCHVLYAWAVSYGVDIHGQLDVPEGGDAPDGPIDLSAVGEGEMKREADRQRRKAKLMVVLEVILREIDKNGIMRKPTWDGVRALLMVLPLTEGISTPVERLQMYETAVNQVYILCSFGALGYDGEPSATAGVNGGSDNSGTQDIHHVRVRIYWYTFVHEGITTGLKGGRLHLDAEDIDTMQDAIHNRSLMPNSSIRLVVKFATAPINLALACRIINKALTGPSAKRRREVDGAAVNEAWEALERCWEEFDSLKYDSPNSLGAYRSPEDVVRFADGWKIFLFEAQNVIRTALEERLAQRTAARASAYIADARTGPDHAGAELNKLQHLLDIARDKCEVKTRQIMDIVKFHVGTRFFEWDASLVRDGTFYTAKLLAKTGGSEDDIAICLQALNELRWAHAKAWDRSAELRRQWQESHPTFPLTYQVQHGWSHPIDPAPNLYVPPEQLQTESSSSLSASPYTSPDIISPVFDMSAGTLPMSEGRKWTTQGQSAGLPGGSGPVYGHPMGPPRLASGSGSHGLYVIPPAAPGTNQGNLPYSSPNG